MYTLVFTAPIHLVEMFHSRKPKALAPSPRKRKLEKTSGFSEAPVSGSVLLYEHRQQKEHTVKINPAGDGDHRIIPLADFFTRAE